MSKDSPAPNRRLGDKYVLGEPLGAGGQGRVVRARHELLGTEVAIKLLHADAERSPEARVRAFLREAQAVARLRHRNVVSVTDFGEQDDEAYLVMELLEGESLRERLLRERTLSAAATTTLVTDVAAALAYCHASGVIHRDLKPENVFFARDDHGTETVKVLDFGTALDAESAPLGTTSGRAPGTPHYMSPEQLSGEAAVDARADLFALGVLAFECLVGRRPFDADAYGELVLQVCTRPLPVPSELAPLPAGFDAWFRKSCARDPEDRFHDATAQARALEGALEGAAEAPPSSPPPSSVSHTTGGGEPTSSLRHRWPYLAAALTVALVGAGFAVRGSTLRTGGDASQGAGATTTPRDPSAHAGGDGSIARERVAVMRLRPLSVGEGDAMLAEVLAGELVTRLSADAAFDLLALTSTQRFGGDAGTDYAGLVATLHADTVVDGTLRIADGRAHVMVELVDPRTTTVRFSRTYSGPVASVESLAREAARDLLSAVHPQAKQKTESRPPARPEAYTAYAYGRYFAQKRDETGLRSAIRHYEEALRLDPDYAPAWVGIADANRLLPWISLEPPKAAMDRARVALGHASALAPDSSDVQTCRGGVLEADWQYADAEAAYRKAIELDPSNAQAHQWLGEFLVLFRRDEEAIAAMARAVELNPLDANLHKQRAAVLFRARRFADAEASARLAVRMDDKQPYGHGWIGYALLWQGKYDEGLAEIHADPMSQPDFMKPFVRIQELVTASLRGNAREVARLYRVVEATHMRQIEPFMMSVAAAAAHEPSAMYEALDAAFHDHSKILFEVSVHPVFDPYRKEPRFVALLDRIGLTPGGPVRK